MKSPVFHSRSHNETAHEQHVGILHVLDTYLEGYRDVPSEKSSVTYDMGPELLPKSSR